MGTIQNGFATNGKNTKWFCNQWEQYKMVLKPMGIIQNGFATNGNNSKWFCNQWEQYKMDRTVKSRNEVDYYYRDTVPLR